MRKRFTKSPKRAFRSVNASKSMRRGRKIMASEFWGNSEFTSKMREIAQDIIDELADGREFVDEAELDDAIKDKLDEAIERECSYAADCLNIIAGSLLFDWSGADYEITSIEDAATYVIESAFYDGYFDDVREAIEGEV